MIDKQQEYHKMADAEKRLWWYRALHSQVMRELKRSNISKEAAILDAGCGTGGLMELLVKKGYQNIQGIDLSEDAINFSRKKGLTVKQDDLRNVTAHFPPASFDVIVSNDVLCYFGEKEEQLEIFSGLESLLKMNGLLIMNLPALKAFRGTHDIGVGIRHRFNRQEVLAHAGRTGFVVRSLRFWPFFLSPLIYAIRTKQRWQIRNNRDMEVESDVSIPAAPLNNLLLGITKLELFMPAFFPFGSSLMVILEKSRQNEMAAR